MIVSKVRYTLGRDHEGQWWIIAPNGETGYPVPSSKWTDPELIGSNVTDWCNRDLTLGTTPVEYGLESADPPPELVGGPGLDDEVYVASVATWGSTEPTRVETLIEGDPARPDRLSAQRAAEARSAYWNAIGETTRANLRPSYASLLAWCTVVTVVDRG